MIELYKNKKWLEKKYLKERLSTYQIAKLYGVSSHSIQYWLIKFNIPIRSHSEATSLYHKKRIGNRKYNNKDWLCDQYLRKKLSIYEIAKLCGVNYQIIRYWLIKYNIPLRSYSEATYLAEMNHCKLSQEAIYFINGELLGDGSLKSISPYSALFNYGSKYLEYIRYIKDTLKSFGIKQAGNINKHYYKNLDCYTYHYNSLCYAELLPIYKNWYPDGRKIVPKDIKLTPLTCKQWYIGDGSLKHSKNRKPTIELSTDGFTISDVEWLVKQLKKLNFKATRQPFGNKVYISAYSVKDFLNYIGDCPVNCYQYKWKC